jgi:glycosyltransferase involved in cell wall biosynthesis
MRILIVISGLVLGGAERQVVLLSKELVRNGHSVSIYTLTRETPRADELKGSPVELVVDQKRSRLDVGVVLRLRRHIVRWRPDVVHGFLYDGNLYARLAAIGLDLPVLNSERNDNYALSFVQAAGYRLTARLADGIVANSHAGAAFARRMHRLPASRVHVVWNCIDLPETESRLLNSRQPSHELWPGSNIHRVCVVGWIRPAKDYPLARRVFRRLIDSNPSWRLVCVGDELSSELSDHKAHVLAERDRLGLEPYVKFVGHRRDVLEIIASCDVLLVTSVHEGFPNVVLEAMACGTPVATTNYSDVRRILPMEWQVVDSRSDGELANVVERCQRQHEEVSAAQRRWVQMNATVSASAEAMLAVYALYTRTPSNARARAT